MKDNQVQLDNQAGTRGGGVGGRVTLTLIPPSLVTGQLTVQYTKYSLQWNLDLTNLFFNEFLGITNDFLQLSQNYKKMYGKKPQCNEPHFNVKLSLL